MSRTRLTTLIGRGWGSMYTCLWGLFTAHQELARDDFGVLKILLT